MKHLESQRKAGGRNQPTPSPHRTRTSWAVLLLGLFIASQTIAQSDALNPDDSDPWEQIVLLKQSLVQQGPTESSFVQTYVPAGFSDGIEESGRLSLDLPMCARWDYEEPYPKSNLLCGRELYTWNPGESIGHLWTIDSSQPGVDLIRLDAEQLSERYSAKWTAPNVLRLTPRVDDHRLLQEAELTLSLDPPHLVRLSYRDGEGNRTSFDFSSPEPVEDRERFSTPIRVSWELEGDG